MSSTDVATDDEDNEVLEKPPKDDLRNITVELEGKELWERFSELGTEMIITKAGRWNSRLLILECCADTLRGKIVAFNTVPSTNIQALTTNKTVPEIKVVKKIRNCFINSFFTYA